ncbi:hypothetical protein GRAN_1557 [Granulicella sibirica]|uniref:Uncharacterized protein n=1 Tax=Granulicella sibirica TaxID=2479048 RepID=A0A4Q0T4J3_9BACT|nr:hypothetical protein GRAN_1557 [Granulicella sibirica]
MVTVIGELGRKRASPTPPDDPEEDALFERFYAAYPRMRRRAKRGRPGRRRE